MSQMTIRAPSVATFESFELELPALSRASSSSGSSSALPLTPSATRDSESDVFAERGMAQSPIQFDALRALGVGASGKRPVRHLVGLGYDFLPSIHVVLAEAEAEEDVEIKSNAREKDAMILDTPACNALFDTPYVDALFDVLSPVAEERDGMLAQMFWALVAVVAWPWLACRGALMPIRPRDGGDGQTIVFVLCAACVLGLGFLALLSLMGCIGAAGAIRTYLDSEL